MKQSMGKILAGSALAALMVGGVVVRPALAYFSTYATATGGIPISVGTTTTTIDDDVKNMVKSISITNTGKSPCFVRVKVYAPDQIKLSFSPVESGDWTDEGNGYWYYTKVLAAEGKTSVLEVTIDPNGYTDNFDVIVVEEHSIVQYDENGDPAPDWNQKISITRTTENAGGEQ